MSGRGATSFSSRWRLEGFFCRRGVRGCLFLRGEGRGGSELPAGAQQRAPIGFAGRGGIWRTSRRGCFSPRPPFLFPSGSSRRGRAAHFVHKLSGQRAKMEAGAAFLHLRKGENRRQAHLPHAKGQVFLAPRTADASGLTGVAGGTTCGSAPKIEKPLDKRTIVS